MTLFLERLIKGTKERERMCAVCVSVCECVSLRTPPGRCRPVLSALQPADPRGQCGPGSSPRGPMSETCRKLPGGGKQCSHPAAGEENTGQSTGGPGVHDVPVLGGQPRVSFGLGASVVRC